MRPLKRAITICGAIVFAELCWFGVKHYRCHERNVAFDRRIQRITQDAQAELEIGTKKADVTKFYVEHKIPFDVAPWPSQDGGFEVIGTLYTIGECAPLGCGTDQALIGVRVSVDAKGTTTGKPEVVAMYTDCL